MYLDFFGFSEPPFSITPDPKFVFLSEKHEESLAHLIYGITRGGGAGFVQLTGEVGTGKTTICRLLLQQIPEKTHIALILNPSISPMELLETICKELKVSVRGVKGKLNAMVDKLNEFLLSSWSQGENTVVIIDEAQNLPRDTLEQLRLLTNLETDKQKLLQIILIGQPELRSTMRRNDLRQLAQRVTARYHLMPLSSIETHAYIVHRMTTAGSKQQLIAPSVSAKAHKLTGGVPRLINILIDRSLLAAYSEGHKRLQNKHIQIAAKEVLPENIIAPQPQGIRKYSSLIIVVLFLIIVFAGMYWKLGYENNAQPNQELVLQKSDVVKHPINFEKVSPQQSWEHYLHLWGVTIESEWSWQQCPDKTNTGMACMHRTGNFKQLEMLNRPVMLHLLDGSLLLLVSLNGNNIGLLGNDNQVFMMDKSYLDESWLGNYMVIWPVPAEILVQPDSEQLQRWGLEMANVISDIPVEKNELQQWIIEFQRLNGLLADGIIGSETQMALSLKAYDGPTLR